VELAWAERDASLLRESIATKFQTTLTSIIASIDWGEHIGDPTNAVHLTVNVAPYELTQPEMETLHQVMEAMFPMVEVVKIVAVPLWAMSPRALAEEFDLVILYNFMEWFRTFIDRMDEFELQNIYVIAPKVFMSLPEVGSQNDELLSKENIFQFLEGRFWGRCQLTFVDISEFSVVAA